ncbi:hypothetical protein OSTOST_06065 [Ostertagia ostertagi]
MNQLPEIILEEQPQLSQSDAASLKDALRSAAASVLNREAELAKSGKKVGNTPCTASPDGRSPAENFIGRRLLCTLDMLKPSKMPKARPDNATEKQYRRNGAKPGSFRPTSVLLATSAADNNDGLLGCVQLRQGCTLYDVLVQGIHLEAPGQSATLMCFAGRNA